MADFETLLTRWESAGVLDHEAAERIRIYESTQTRPSGLRWQVLVALILGAMLLACGVVLFVSAHWDGIGPIGRYALVMTMLATFHLAGAGVRGSYRGLSTSLHAVGTVCAGAAIALVGQIFNIQEHWPAAVLMWALAALAGWILLRDEAQQTLTLLLVPAWILCEFEFYAFGHVGHGLYLGRFLVVWAILYLTVFQGTSRKMAQGILFAASAVAALVGTVLLMEGWRSWGQNSSPLGFQLRVWGWLAIAVLPLLIALFRWRASVVPVGAAVIFTVVLPFCMLTQTRHNDFGTIHNTYTYSEPNLLARLLVATFAVFVIWWGVHQASKALVNLGMVWFAMAVAWFYFSDLFDKMDRSLGLIGLGVLFLAGGWGLEKMRRGLLAGMVGSEPQSKEAV